MTDLRSIRHACTSKDGRRSLSSGGPADDGDTSVSVNMHPVVREIRDRPVPVPQRVPVPVRQPVPVPVRVPPNGTPYGGGPASRFPVSSKRGGKV
jgi:hypothetical protein